MSQTVAGGLVNWALEGSGVKPEVLSKWKDVDPFKSQEKTISGNIKNFAQASELWPKERGFSFP